MTPGTKTAYIDLVITATDKDSNTLPVVTVGNPTLTFPTTITFTEEYREGKRFTLIATDSGSRVSECSFTIRITGKIRIKLIIIINNIHRTPFTKVTKR